MAAKGSGNGNGVRPTSGSGKWSRYAPPLAAECVSWADVEAQEVLAAISAVTAEGDAVLFSRTRDGGALVITVCAGDERVKLYATSVLLMAGHLQALANGPE